MSYRIILALVLALIAPLSGAYIVDGSRVSQPRLLSFAKDKLHNHGVITQDKNGSTYLKVADQYLNDLIRQVKKQGFQIPNDGAHISVIAPNEAHNLQLNSEIGSKIEFKPLGFYTIVQDDQEYFMLAIDAPELSSLREKYGLPEKLDDHEFNLVIGVRTLKAHDELAD